MAVHRPNPCLSIPIFENRLPVSTIDVDGLDIVSDLNGAGYRIWAVHFLILHIQWLAVELELPNLVFASISTSDSLVPCNF